MVKSACHLMDTGDLFHLVNGSTQEALDRAAAF